MAKKYCELVVPQSSTTPFEFSVFELNIASLTCHNFLVWEKWRSSDVQGHHPSRWIDWAEDNTAEHYVYWGVEGDGSECEFTFETWGLVSILFRDSENATMLAVLISVRLRQPGMGILIPEMDQTKSLDDIMEDVLKKSSGLRTGEILSHDRICKSLGDGRSVLLSLRRETSKRGSEGKKYIVDIDIDQDGTLPWKIYDQEAR